MNVTGSFRNSSNVFSNISPRHIPAGLSDCLSDAPIVADGAGHGKVCSRGICLSYVCCPVMPRSRSSGGPVLSAVISRRHIWPGRSHFILILKPVFLFILQHGPVHGSPVPGIQIRQIIFPVFSLILACTRLTVGTGITASAAPGILPTTVNSLSR